MPTFLALAQDDQGALTLASFTAASVGAAETAIDNAISAQLTTGLAVNPNTGQPDVRIAVRAAAQKAAQPPADGANILLLQVVGATKVLPGATPQNPDTGWTT